ENAPANSHSPIVYPIAVVQDSENPEAAQSYLEFLSGETAKSVFEKYGFKMAT
ncbi:MAG: molybdate ABC transporter substrate-binding protein, partial [Limnospira sp.]